MRRLNPMKIIDKIKTPWVQKEPLAFALLLFITLAACVAIFGVLYGAKRAYEALDAIDIIDTILAIFGL